VVFPPKEMPAGKALPQGRATGKVKSAQADTHKAEVAEWQTRRTQKTPSKSLKYRFFRGFLQFSSPAVHYEKP
jgi:hypothetical protein